MSKCFADKALGLRERTTDNLFLYSDQWKSCDREMPIEGRTVEAIDLGGGIRRVIRFKHQWWAPTTPMVRVLAFRPHLWRYVQ
jgi:hypothetical protein